MKPALTREQILKTLDALYDKALNGIPKMSKPVEEFADYYVIHHRTTKEAAQAMLKAQIAKCGASGMLTGMGGAITLPVSIPANITSVLYMQLRMIAALAYMGGYDVRTEQVRTMVYVCLTGHFAADILKKARTEIGKVATEQVIKNIPETTLKALTEKVEISILTKLGEEGAVNLAKLIPIAGGAIGGITDMASTKTIGKTGYRVFIQNKI